MEVIQYFHMNGGSGTSETNYSSNSFIQKNGIELTKPIIEEAILETINSTSSGQNISKSISIAEMGCSSGPNSLLAVSYIMNTIHNKFVHESDGALGASPPHPEILVFLNDLSSIVFNIIFKSLHGFYDELKKTYKKLGDADDAQKQHRFFVAGIPGSFYDRLFPSDSLHFVHSSYSLHWLSQSPQGIEKSNKGNIYMAESSPPSVLEAYQKQFERDFSSFLMCRLEEIVKGGRMELTIFGRANGTSPSSDMRCHMWGLLAEALRDMVSQDKIEEEKLDSFNMPLYVPSPSEVKAVILTEGSFTINRLETFEVTLGEGEEIFRKGEDNDDNDMLTGSRSFVNFMRAISESLLVSHFGEEIIEELYERYRKIVAPLLSREESAKTKHLSIVISIARG
ncbi:hypothetical protein MKW92_001195 [Papaver armeniacum]|nr:hypothetical protein MKW92_001195 [Papaver armeniacum]